jgi:SOS-response transcriptional repressor LexA
MYMHRIQEALLRLAHEQDLSKITLREIAAAIGEPNASPGLLQYHFEKLEEKNLVFVDRKRQIQRLGSELADDQLVSIPIVGSANCGPASLFAIESSHGYLRLSKKIIKKADGLIALIANGDSMNAARINTPSPGVKAPIHGGDLVVVDTTNKAIEDGYILSVIDGMANLKRLKKRSYDIALISESKNSYSYPPIIITSEDDYMINGRVIMVCQP